MTPLHGLLICQHARGPVKLLLHRAGHCYALEAYSPATSGQKRNSVLWSDFFGSTYTKDYELGIDLPGNGSRDFYMYDNSAATTLMQVVSDVCQRKVALTAPSFTTPILKTGVSSNMDHAGQITLASESGTYTSSARMPRLPFAWRRIPPLQR